MATDKNEKKFVPYVVNQIDRYRLVATGQGSIKAVDYIHDSHLEMCMGSEPSIQIIAERRDIDLLGKESWVMCSMVEAREACFFAWTKIGIEEHRSVKQSAVKQSTDKQ